MNAVEVEITVDVTVRIFVDDVDDRHAELVAYLLTDAGRDKLAAATERFLTGGAPTEVGWLDDDHEVYVTDIVHAQASTRQVIR